MLQDERSHKESLLLGLRKFIRSQFDDLTDLFKDFYFLLSLLNCALNPSKYIDDSDSLEIIAQIDVRKFFLDMALHHFDKHCNSFCIFCVLSMFV